MEEREVVSYIPQMILRYVREAQGRRAADAVQQAAGLGDLGPGVWERNRWWSVGEVLALAQAASAATGDSDIGRRAGETLMRAARQNDIQNWAPGSVVAAVAGALDNGSKMSTGCLYELLEPERDGELFFAGHYRDISRTDAFFCSFTAGYYSQLPSLFGARAVVTEPECQFRGDERCLFHMRWWPSGGTAELGGPNQAASASDMFNLARFEELQTMATELVAAEDVQTVLERITAQAGTALQAPRYLLAVRTSEDDLLRVHHFGFSSDASAQEFAVGLLAGRFGAADGVAAVEVASSRHSFGKLAAVFAPGAHVSGYDQRLLKSYAGHAAAALDVITSLAAARRDRDTAEALLGLAHRLTKAADENDIAQWLADAVPAVTGAERGAVWLGDAPDALHLAATDASAHPADLGTAPRRPELGPEALDGLVVGSGPFWIDSESVGPRMRGILERHGLAAAGVAPLSSGEAFAGAIVAGYVTSPPQSVRADVLARLRGLSDHATIAFAHAALVIDMRRQALHDSLTGLPNRRLVEDRAGVALRRTDRSQGGLALLFADLDRFKTVNDTLGHAAGDELLQAVAERLGGVVRESDTLARLGGDEFVVLAGDVASEEEAVAVAERMIGALAQPFQVAGRDLYVTASIGVAYPADGSGFDGLIRRADAAMYEAKALGGNTYSVHSPRAAAQRRHRLQLESELHQALDRDELRVFYQPQFDLASGRMVGAEALVRWAHPERGLLLPGAFLASAEASGLIVGIDRFVRATAFAQGAEWAGRGRAVRVAVNLSSRDLRRADLASRIGAEMDAAGVDPGLVELEITDSVAMGAEDLAAVLRELRALGTRLAIDDFGTGNSVLSRLEACPVDTLKIDRRFVHAIGPDGHAPVLRAIIDLAHRVGSTSLAEGAETAGQAAALRDYGCELVQGFHFGRPVPPELLPEPGLTELGVSRA